MSLFSGKGAPRLRLRLAAALVAAGLASAAPLSAQAQDAAPSITIGATTPDPAGHGVTLSDVKIAYPGANGTAIGISRLVIKGLDASGDTFKAREIAVEGLTTRYVAGAEVQMAVDAATITDVSGPLPSADKLGAAARPGSLPPLGEWLLAAKAKSIRIPTVSVRTTFDKVHSLAIYKDIAVTGIDAGRVAAMLAAGASQETTGGTPEANSKITIGRMSVEDIDFNVYAAWLDDAIAAAAPKEKRLVYRTFSARDMAMTVENMTMTMAKISGSDVKVGPPPMKPSELLALLAKMSSNPKLGEEQPAEAIAFTRGILGAFTLGTMAVEGLAVSEAGKPPVEIGLFRIEDYAGARIGEIRLGDMAMTDPKEGAVVKLGSFAIRGFEIVDLETMLDKIARSESPDDLPLEQYPKLRVAGVAVADLDVSVPGKGEFSIGGFTLDTPDWIGFLPTSIKTRVAGFSMPIDAIDDEKAREGFAALGLGTLTINSTVDAEWKEADQTLALGPISLDIDGIGKAEVGGALGGVPRSVFENPETAQAAIVTLDFRGLTLSLQDGGAFAKLIAQAAKKKNTTPAKLAQQLSLQIQGGMIGLLGMEEAGKQLGAAVQAFITNPRSFNLAVHALEPIPALTLIQVKGGDKASLDLVKKAIRIEARANK